MSNKKPSRRHQPLQFADTAASSSTQHSGNILKRCKGVIEDLQQELDLALKQLVNKDQHLDKLNQQISQHLQQKAQLESLIGQLKSANQLMTSELNLARDANECTAAEIAQLRRAVKLRDTQIARMDQELKKMHQRLCQEENTKRGLDQQWERALQGVETKLHVLESQLQVKNDENYKLQALLNQPRQCSCSKQLVQLRERNNDLEHRIFWDSRPSPSVEFMRTKHSPNTTTPTSFSISNPEEESRNQLSFNKNNPASETRYTEAISGQRSVSCVKRQGPINNTAYISDPIRIKAVPPFTPERVQFSQYKMPVSNTSRKEYLYSRLENELEEAKGRLIKQQHEFVSESGVVGTRIDRNRVQRTLDQLEDKLSRMVNRIENSIETESVC